MNGNIDFDREWKELRRAVGEAAKGRWPWIIKAISPMLTELVSKWEKRPNSAPPVSCPLCGKAEYMRGLKLFGECGLVLCQSCGRFNGFELLHKTTGMTYGDISIEIAQMTGVQSVLVDIANSKGGVSRPVAAAVPPPCSGPSEEDILLADAKNARRMKCAWDAAVPMNAPEALAARVYLARRGLMGVGYGIAPVQQDALRFHPGMDFYEEVINEDTGEVAKVLRGQFPAILAATKYPNGQRVAIQRYFITPEGTKAPFAKTKKMMPTLQTRTPQGSSTQLDKAGLVLGVGEGLETMLSARLLTGLPVWATHTAGMLEATAVPDETRYVIVFADKDRSERGRQAALTLIERMRGEGRKAVAYMPPMEIPEGKKSVDWNDVLLADGVEKTRGLEFLNVQLKRLREMLVSDGHSAVADAIPNESEVLRHAAV